MKYKVGDRVKIREDLKVDKRYNDCSFTDKMEKYKGKTATVLETIGRDYYELDIDDHKWFWSDGMLELAKFTKDDLKPKDVLTARDGSVFVVGKNGDILYANNGIRPFGVGDTSLNRDLTNNGDIGKNFDIVKVERPQVIWEREEKTNEELHREMWNWLAENPEKKKSDWLDKEKISARDNCFACEECNGDCNKCPLDSEVIGCHKPNGLWHVWRTSENADFRKALARVIAELPWKSVK